MESKQSLPYFLQLMQTQAKSLPLETIALPCFTDVVITIYYRSRDSSADPGNSAKTLNPVFERVEHCRGREDLQRTAAAFFRISGAHTRGRRSGTMAEARALP